MAIAGLKESLTTCSGNASTGTLAPLIFPLRYRSLKANNVSS